MSTHTPGPWFAAWRHPYVERADSICAIYSESQRGDIHPIEVAMVYCAKPGTVEEANAYLIAAAPELLEALRLEEEWQARAADGALDPEWDYEVMVGAKRRAALAKATGAAA